MMKRLAAAGFLSLTVGGVMLSASPAMANDRHEDPKSSNTQVLGVQTCRSVEVGVIAVVVHNILGTEKEQGKCANGSSDKTTAVNGSHASGNDD
ncbi:hypothetical protein GEV43_14315 [Actinomadura sp. J1-007]|nr:hypothetical protein [Actinomadura sp. J1-007]